MLHKSTNIFIKEHLGSNSVWHSLQEILHMRSFYFLINFKNYINKCDIRLHKTGRIRHQSFWYCNVCTCMCYNNSGLYFLKFSIMLCYCFVWYKKHQHFYPLRPWPHVYGFYAKLAFSAEFGPVFHTQPEFFFKAPSEAQIFQNWFLCMCVHVKGSLWEANCASETATVVDYCTLVHGLALHQKGVK